MNDEIWIVDDDASIRWVLEKALEQNNLRVRSFSDASSVIANLSGKRPSVIVTDIRMPEMDGFELLRSVQQRVADLPVIIMTAHTDLDSALTSYKRGAFEYLPKPFDVNDAVSLIQRAREHARQTAAEPSAGEDWIGRKMIGEAPAMQSVFRAIGRLSASDMNVLICGESGTGKELVAKALHDTGLRSDRPFVAINVAAIPGELLESELFGHEKGAFTGAVSQRKGRFEQAHTGTLFLDEIGDMPASLQTRLLRVLSEGRFYRVGGHDQLEVDVRIVAATNQDLESFVQTGDFREDLFHRLNVIRINIPPLRERREDIPALVKFFLSRSAADLKVEPKQMDKATVAFLKSRAWPGNVRQLENICRWLTVMAPGKTVTPDDLPDELKRQDDENGALGDWESDLVSEVRRKLNGGEKDLLDSVGKRFEKLMLETALIHCSGHKQEAARCLGWGRNTLTRKLKELDIDSRFGKQTGSGA